MSFSGKMCYIIILTFTKNQGFTPSLKNTVSEKPQGASNWLFRKKIVYKKLDQWYNEWQQVRTSGTTSDNQWYNEWQRATTSDNKWQPVTKNDNEWQQMTANDKTNEYE